jgi:membrane protein implicated in regulation of membrane protease activity
MDIHPSWIWMGLAALFIIGEIFTAGFFLLWFGIGAAVAGVLALLGAGAIWQWVAFVVVSGVLYLGSRRFAERVTRQQPPGIGADRYLQQHGIVLDEVNRVKHTGRVRLGGDEWRAESAGGEIIPAGAAVTVVKVDGTNLVVSPNKEE